MEKSAVEGSASSASTTDGHDVAAPNAPPLYLEGARLWTAAVGIGLSIFLPAAEITIVSTSLVTISNDLSAHSQSNWLITSYLLTFTGFLTVWAKCTEIFGFKPSMLSSLLLFVAFCGGCGAAQTMNQLIICRAFQGVGGSGVFSLSLFGLIRIARPDKFDAVSAAGSVVIAIGLILGSLIGGAICSANAWRWIFLFNVPAGAISWILIFFAIPKNFTDRNIAEGSHTFFGLMLFKTKEFLIRADPIGCLLLLAFSMLFVAALQEANVTYAWSSGLIISFLTVSGVLGIAFLLWEWFIGIRRVGRIEPMFPWRMTRDRVWMGVLLGFFLSGPAVTILYIEIPQRLQTANNSSPVGAGVKLLAFALGSPVGSFFCTLFSGRFRLPFVYLVIMGAILQTIGAFLLSSIPITLHIWGGQYGYMVLTGIGVGLSMTSFYMSIPVVVSKDDQSIGIGLSLQIRMLGASLGIAIVNSILINYVKHHLNPLEALIDPNALSGLPSEIEEKIRSVYAAGYNLQMKAVGAFGAAQFLAAALMWKKEQARFIK